MHDQHDLTVDTTTTLAAVLGDIPPVGIWKSADGAVCLDIRQDGTYAGQVAGRRRRPHGTYDIDGATMTLSDDSGLSTPVVLLGEALEMAGYRLGRAG
jgi:Agrobacterium tumefaciens protein Atu4866